MTKIDYLYYNLFLKIIFLIITTLIIRNIMEASSNQSVQWTFLPAEIWVNIFEYSTEEEQYTKIFLVNRLFKDLIEECFCKQRLYDFTKTLPESQFCKYLGSHYTKYVKIFHSMLLTEQENSLTVIQKKSRIDLALENQETRKMVQEQFELCLGFSLKEGGEVPKGNPYAFVQKNKLITQEDTDSALYYLALKNFKVPSSRKIIYRTNGFGFRQTYTHDPLFEVLIKKYSAETLRLIAQNYPEPVCSLHINCALSNKLSNEHLLTLIKHLPQEPCHSVALQSPIPKIGLSVFQRSVLLDSLVIKLLNGNYSDDVVLALIEKMTEVSFDVIYNIIISQESEAPIRCSDQVLSALFTKFPLDQEDSLSCASRLIPYFIQKLPLADQASNYGVAPLETFLDCIAKQGLLVPIRIKNLVLFYSCNNSRFEGQEELMYKLACVLKAPVDSGDIEYAIMHKYSERVVVKLLKKSDANDIVTQNRCLDFALCDNPQPAIVGTLLDMGCEVQFEHLRRALSGNRGLKGIEEKDYVIPPDETVLKIIEKFNDKDSFHFYSIMHSAFEYKRSDDVILNLMKKAIELGLPEEKFSNIGDFIKQAKREGRSKELISLLQSKSTSTCVMM